MTLTIPNSWLTPRPGREAPIHRWFVFPHSFAPELVSWLIRELDIGRGSTLLDPFCGAGTTLVEGERLGLKPVGVDLLPLAVFASAVKLSRPSEVAFHTARKRAVDAASDASPRHPPGALLKRAMTPTVYGRLRAALDSAYGPAGDHVRLGVLSVVRMFSRLVADGGWLRKVEPQLRPRFVARELDEALARIEMDLEDAPPSRGGQVFKGDARSLPCDDNSIDVVITSPPYPNRHDYTRVFGVEHELVFSLGEQVRELRYGSLRSHPEARPRYSADEYRAPRGLDGQIAKVADAHPDPRIPRMLTGYFQDLDLVLRELARIVKKDGTVVLVVGNAQYMGVPIPVDAYLESLASRAGFTVEDRLVLRMRGNSAQQMASHGRRPSRESAVILSR